MIEPSFFNQCSIHKHIFHCAVLSSISRVNKSPQTLYTKNERKSTQVLNLQIFEIHISPLTRASLALPWGLQCLWVPLGVTNRPNAEAEKMHMGTIKVILIEEKKKGGNEGKGYFWWGVGISHQLATRHHHLWVHFNT